MVPLEILMLGSRLLLGGVFFVAAVAKLVDRPGSHRSLGQFGVPEAVVPAVAIALPAAELAIAVALLFQATATGAAVAAAALLTVFVVAISYNLARGRQPDCHCFGQLHSEPVGWSVLARNSGLVAVAVIIATTGWANPGPDVTVWLSSLSAFEAFTLFGGAAGLATLIAQSRALRTLGRQQHLVLERLAALASGPAADHTPGGSRVAGKSMGSRAPDFALPGVDGQIVTLDQLRSEGLPVVLVFSDPDCGPCDALLPQIADWQRIESHAFVMAVVSRGTAESNRPKRDAHNLRHVLIQTDREVADSYGVWGTPSAVMVRPDGTVGSVLSQAEDQIRELIASLQARAVVANGSTPTPTPTPTPAPPEPPPALASTPPITAGGGLTMQTLSGPRPVPITDVPLDMRLKQEKCVQAEPLPDGGAVLYNGCNRQILTLNATASLVWEYCDSEHEVRAIVSELRDVFPAAAEVERDVRQVIQMLLDVNMVSPVGSIEAAPAAVVGP